MITKHLSQSKLLSNQSTCPLLFQWFKKYGFVLKVHLGEMLVKVGLTIASLLVFGTINAKVQNSEGH